MPYATWSEDSREILRKFMTEHIPFNKLLGVEVGELREGFARMEVPYRPELIGDPMRPAIHGGVLSTLIDACGGARGKPSST